MYRANFTFATKLLYMSIFTALGDANFQESRRYIDSGGEHNEEFVADIFTVAQVLLIILTIGRAALLLISIKKLNITKTYFYY